MADKWNTPEIMAAIKAWYHQQPPTLRGNISIARYLHEHHGIEVTRGQVAGAVHRAGVVGKYDGDKRERPERRATFENTDHRWAKPKWPLVVLEESASWDSQKQKAHAERLKIDADITRLRMEGLSVPAIARAVGVSEKTVTRRCVALGVKSVAQAGWKSATAVSRRVTPPLPKPRVHISGGKPYADRGECQFVINDASPFLFCGEPAAKTPHGNSKSWCVYCTGRVYGRPPMIPRAQLMAVGD